MHHPLVNAHEWSNWTSTESSEVKLYSDPTQTRRDKSATQNRRWQILVWEMHTFTTGSNLIDDTELQHEPNFVDATVYSSCSWLKLCSLSPLTRLQNNTADRIFWQDIMYESLHSLNYYNLLQTWRDLQSEVETELSIVSNYHSPGSAFSPVQWLISGVLPLAPFAPNNKWHHAHNFYPSWQFVRKSCMQSAFLKPHMTYNWNL